MSQQAEVGNPASPSSWSASPLFGSQTGRSSLINCDRGDTATSSRWPSAGKGSGDGEDGQDGSSTPPRYNK